MKFTHTLFHEDPKFNRFTARSTFLLLLTSTCVAQAQQPSTLQSCSISGTTTSTLKFHNNYSQNVDIFWLNYQCQEQFYFSLAPGATFVQPSYVTHPWRIRERTSGKILKQVTSNGSGTKNVPVVDECSASSNDTAQLEITNNTNSSVVVYWKDFTCQERYYATLNAGKKQTFSTYAAHTWRIRKTKGGTILKDIQLNSTGLNRVAVSERSTTDNIDDSSFYQTHTVYVLPSDAVDKQLDRNGAIATSVAAAQKWLTKQANGQRLRFDTYKGALDTSYVRLSKTDAQMIQQAIQQYGNAAFLREVIQSELNSRGFNDNGTLYIAYYGGTSPHSCGGASYPPDGPQGNVVALYLWGNPPGSSACPGNVFAKDDYTPGYWEFALVHDLFHAMGTVPNPVSASIPDYCAPHHTLSGHVYDSPTDLMYAGTAPWNPSVLDFGNDDYFNHGDLTCPDLARSVFLSPASADAVPPLGWR